MPGEIIYLKTRKEFIQYITNHPVVIVKYTATWCGPCKKIAKLVQKLFNKMSNNVSMIIVDIDVGKDITSYMRVKSIPTMCNYIEGEPMDSVIGSKTDTIINFFTKTTKHAHIL